MRFAFFEPPISDRPVVYMSRDGRLRLLTAPCLLQNIPVWIKEPPGGDFQFFMDLDR